MSGSVTIFQYTGTTTGTSVSTVQGPFQPYQILPAASLNNALLYGNKLGGNLDDVTIGSTTPGPGTFTTLYAATPISGAFGQEVPTVAWVRGYVSGGSGGGGGGGVSVDSPVFTGVPKAPTAAPGTNNTQIATTAFVGSALGNTKTATRFTPPGGVGGYMFVNGSNQPKVLTKAPWQTINVIGPATNDTYYLEIKFPCQMSALKIYLPNAATSASLTIKLLQNNNPVGASSGYTATLSTTSTQTITTPINFSIGDVVGFNVSGMSGSPRNLTISPDGNVTAPS